MTDISKSDEVVGELLNLLARARHMRTEYNRVSHDKSPYSVDDYLELIGRYTGYDIDLKDVDWGSKGLIRGVCLPFDGNKVIIRVPESIDDNSVNGATDCERRYITLKEAAHLVIDEEDAYVEDCLALVDAILFEAPHVGLDQLEKDGRSDLFYGKIFAMELLFPAEYRDGVKDEIEKGLSTYEAAKRYLIPEKELIWFLSDAVHPGLKYFRKMEGSLEHIYLKKFHPDAAN